MTMISVEYTYLEFVGGGSSKFYTAYRLGTFTAFHWGPIGAAGTGSIANAGTSTAANNAVHKQVDAKLAKGYTKRAAGTFQINAEDFQKQRSGLSDKAAVQWLHANYVRAQQNIPNSGKPTTSAPPAPVKPKVHVQSGGGLVTPKAAPIQPDKLEKFVERAKDALTMAATDPNGALVEAAILAEDLEELDGEFRKAHSYLQTLQAMTLEAMAG